MNGSGLSALISGFQQGYGFSTEMNRRKKQDERDEFRHGREVVRAGREDKEFERDDKWRAEHEAIDQEFGFGPKKPAPVPEPIAAGMPGPTATPLAPADPAAPAPAAPAVAATPAIAAAAAPASAVQPPAVAASPAAPAPAAMGMPPAPPAPIDVGKLRNYTLRKAEVDFRNGKIDGTAYRTLMKSVQSDEKEGRNDAIKMLNAGRTDEGLKLYNESGDLKINRVLDVKEAVYEADGVKYPTKIYTLEDQNGRPIVINTMQDMYTSQAMKDLVASAQKGKELTTTEKKNADDVRIREGQLKETARGNDLSYRAHMASVGVQQAGVGVQQQRLELEKSNYKRLTPSGQFEEIKKLLPDMSPDDEKRVKEHLIGLSKDKDVDGKLVSDLTTEWVKNNPNATAKEAASYKETLTKSFGAIKTNAQVMSAVKSELDKAGKPDSPAYAQTYAEAKALGLTDAQLANLGYKAPPAAAAVVPERPGSKAAAPVPAYMAPADSSVGKMQARTARLSAYQQEQAGAVKQVQESFAADSSTLSPLDLLQKYDTVRGQLTPQQRLALKKAEQNAR
jgi:hypothetical protein